MAKAVINTPFKGAIWSERIWKRQDALADVVGKLTQDAIFMGHSGDWIKTRLRKEFDVTAYEARRLAVTELARVQTAVQKESYERNDFEKYIYMAEPTACDICAELDGKTFLVKDMTPGKNACPMHPHCKCSSAPDVSDERAELDRLLDERVAEREEGFVVKEGELLHRKHGRLSYDKEKTKIVRDIPRLNKTIEFNARKVRGSHYNNLFVSETLKSKKKAIRYHDNQLKKVEPLVNDKFEGLELPRVVILDSTETSDGSIASYRPIDNTIFVRGDVTDDSQMLELQDETLVLSDNPLSTLIHELGHAHQFLTTKTKNKDNSKVVEEIAKVNSEMVEKMIMDGYNIGRKISKYASLKAITKPEEVYAEMFVKDILGNSEIIDKWLK